MKGHLPVSTVTYHQLGIDSYTKYQYLVVLIDQRKRKETVDRQYAGTPFEYHTSGIQALSSAFGQVSCRRIHMSCDLFSFPQARHCCCTNSLLTRLSLLDNAEVRMKAQHCV